ncbi:MAG: alpha/beta hydrolase [Verrucomicrobiota bacterium]
MVIRDIPYTDAHARHIGDLLLPAHPQKDVPPVLLIHGGSWNSMSKEALAPIARLAAGEGRAVFSINYRLLDHAPWPACRDDCVAAARFVLAGGLAAHGLPAPQKLLICGASAGGHLAMLTGLALGAHACAGIVSLAGPSRVERRDDSPASAISGEDFLKKFFGHSAPPSPEEFMSASPSALVTSDAPPLVCIHSRNDRLVPPPHSEEAVAAWRACGLTARLDYFDGLDDLHAFWTPGDLQTRELIPSVAELLRRTAAA